MTDSTEGSCPAVVETRILLPTLSSDPHSGAFSPSSLHPIPEDDTVRFFALPPGAAPPQPYPSAPSLAMNHSRRDTASPVTGPSPASSSSISPSPTDASPSMMLPPRSCRSPLGRACSTSPPCSLASGRSALEGSPVLLPAAAYRFEARDAGAAPASGLPPASGKETAAAGLSGFQGRDPYCCTGAEEAGGQVEGGKAADFARHKQQHEQQQQQSSQALLLQLQGCQQQLMQKQHEWQQQQQQGLVSTEIPGSPGSNAEYGSAAAVQRMWEGDLCDCWDDTAMAAQTVCCPCVTFGENMAMAGFGQSPTQALLYFALTYGACSVSQLTGICCCNFDFFSTLGFGLFFIGTAYAAYFRTEMRKRFNIHGDESTDCMNHAFCSCCALCQENRTLKVNNVHRGVWSGRGDMSNMMAPSKGVCMDPPTQFEMTVPQQGSDFSSSIKSILVRTAQSLALQDKPVNRSTCAAASEAVELKPSRSGETASSPRPHPFAFSAKEQSSAPFLDDGQ